MGKRKSLLLLLAALLGSALAYAAVAYTPSGDLAFPAEYREWVFLGSGVGMTYGPARSLTSGDHPAVDNVFVDPSAYKYFVANGTWPDKAEFVLEVRKSEAQGSINKGGFYQGDLAAIEVHRKDSHLPGGWGFFDFPQKSGGTGKLLPQTASCYSCHAAHGAVDTTFVQFYPTLRPIAQAKGTYKAE